MAKIETNTVKPEISFSYKDSEKRILNFDVESKLDLGISSLTNYMIDNTGRGLTELENDALYIKAQSLWKEYQDSLKNAKMNFYLNRPQYMFLTGLLLNKMEYDINTVFIALELSELLVKMKTGVKFSNDEELDIVEVDATEITYIYHLIATYKVKGLGKEAYLFSEILRRIGEISKIVSYYDTSAKNLTDTIATWAISLDGGDVAEAIPEDENKKLNPKNKKVKVSSE